MTCSQRMLHVYLSTFGKKRFGLFFVPVMPKTNPCARNIGDVRSRHIKCMVQTAYQPRGLVVQLFNLKGNTRGSTLILNLTLEPPLFDVETNEPITIEIKDR